MSDEMSCEQVRELAAELAIGIADGQERDAALQHCATCTGCRSLVADLSRTADDLLLLAPEHEPPRGFRSRTIDRLEAQWSRARTMERLAGEHRTSGRASQATRDRVHHRTRRMRAVVAAASIVFAIAAGSAGTYVALSDDLRVADSYRAVLAEGNGSFFVASAVQGATGRVGTVYGYQGSPSWIFATVNLPGSSQQSFDVRLTTRSGQQVSVGSATLGGTANTWGQGIPVDLADVTRLQFVSADGKVSLVAYIDAANPWSSK